MNNRLETILICKKDDKIGNSCAAYFLNNLYKFIMLGFLKIFSDGFKKFSKKFVINYVFAFMFFHTVP